MVSGPDKITGLALDDEGYLFVSFYGTPPNWIGRIGKFTTSGATVNAALIPGIQSNWGTAIDESGLLFIAYNTYPGRIAQYTTSGALISSFYTGLGSPTAIALDGNGHVFVGNDYGGIAEYATSGAVVNSSLIPGLTHSRGVAVAVPPGVPVLVAGDRTNEVGSSTSFTVRCAGTRPLNYQWFLDGTNAVSGATNSVLALTNVQPSQAGAYTVVITNVFGAVMSAPARLTIVGDPPAIPRSPPSQTAEARATVRFGARVTGIPAPVCLWLFNATNLISCSTNCELLLTNVQPSQSGVFTVVVTNVLGAATSSPAMLSVIAPVERRQVPSVNVAGEVGSLLNVDYANSLSPAPNWTPLGSVSLTSPSQYWFDLTVPQPPQRFYRAWQTGTPSVISSLSLPGLVPAITLTGSIGHSMRLDYINQFGPIDAWVTLDTVTLTKASQLYFDVSAPGQPQRLYRLVQVP